MKNKINLSIGIAAYNAEKNIVRLVNSILAQKQVDFNIVKIRIHSDNSSDNTITLIKSLKNKHISLIDNKTRKGFAGSIKTLLQESPEEVVILLNDDIVINDNLFINKLIRPFLDEDNVGLVCGRPTPLTPTNFLQKGLVSSFNAYDDFRLNIKNGNNKYTCDGKILAFSKSFKGKINYPKDLSDMGNSDIYIYLMCLKTGFKYRFVKDAVVYYKNPETLEEVIKLNVRDNSNKYLLRKTFGDLVDKEYYVPPILFWSSLVFESIKNPFGSFIVFVIGLISKFKAKDYSNKFNSKWDALKTSKNYE